MIIIVKRTTTAVLAPDARTLVTLLALVLASSNWSALQSDQAQSISFLTATLIAAGDDYIHLVEIDILPLSSHRVQSQVSVLDFTTAEAARLDRSASDRA